MSFDFRNIILKGIFVGFYFISLPIFGQLDTVHLKEVEVKEKYPVFSAINSANCDSIHKMKSISASLSDVISYEPGITVKSYGDGGLATVSFRGADPSHTKATWNDMPINSCMNGQVDFSLIPASPSDKILLYYGANSLAYQSGALGGMVKLSSATFNNLKPGFEVKQETGSFGLMNTYVGAMLGNKNLKSMTRLSYHKADNDFTYENNAILPKQKMKQNDAGFERLSLIEEILFQKNNHDFALRYWQSNSFRSIPSLMTNVESSEHNETQSDKSIRILAEWNYHRDCFKTFIRQGVSYADLLYKLEHVSGSSLVTYIHSLSKEKMYFASAGGRYCFSNSVQLNASLDYVLQNAEIFENREEVGFSVNSYVLDGMLDLETNLKPWLNMSTLVRIKKQQSAEVAYIPAVFFSIRPMKSFVIKTSVSRNENYPTLNDLYFYPGGNPDLKPEQGFQSDISLNYKNNFLQKNKIEAEVDLFYSDINNWILWQPTPFGYWSPENVREVVSRGIQSKISIILLMGKNKFSFSGAYTYNIASAYNDEFVTTQ